MHGRCTAKDPRDPTGFHICGSYALNNHPESGLCDVCWERHRAEEAEACVAELKAGLLRLATWGETHGMTDHEMEAVARETLTAVL